MQDNSVEKIKERISVADLLRDYLKLEKAGSNYKALCPFHNEKTPSFMVNTERNFWYCFGCQKGGDIFNFIQEMEGIEFREALERLADRAGIELPKYQGKEAYAQVKSQKQKSYEILELATRVYQHQLKNSEQGKISEKYLKERNITEKEIQEFRLGYAPNSWRATLNFLTKKGYTVDEILKTGLLVQKDDLGYGAQLSANNVYDRFRDRIMFPIIDITGKVLGYSARVAPGGDDKNAKYINTSQTDIYDKSKVLYGLYQGRQEIKKKNFAVIVEGNMDVIASHRAGLKNVVAVSGTALTVEQARLLKRYTKNIKLCFDMDDAGQKATQKSIQVCLSEGMEVEVITLESGAKDVGDVVQEKPELWLKAVDSSLPVMNYFFDATFGKYNVDDIREKKIIAKELLNVVKDIADPIEQSYWLNKLSIRLGVEEEKLTEVVEKVRLKEKNDLNNRGGQSEQREVKKNKAKHTALEERLLGLSFLYHDDLAKEIRTIDRNILSFDYVDLWDQIISGGFDRKDARLNQFAVKIKYDFDKSKGLIEFAENGEIDCLKEWRRTVTDLWEELRRMRKRQLGIEIKQAEEAGDEEKVALLEREFSELSRL